MRNIAILGSTGSIGTQSLDIIRANKEFNVTALTCNGNISLMERQIREFFPNIVCVGDKESAKTLKSRVYDIDVEVVYGMEGLRTVAVDDRNDTVITAIVGMIGLLPTIDAIKAKKTICLANKETLVTAGHIIMPLAKECDVPIIPVDSEHSAIFQSLQGDKNNKIKQILLTASGGPFRGKSKDDLMTVTLEDALKHPNWSMGKKITIDSATMVNKGLEVIEAKWLFDVSLENINILVHPQSILHSAVEFEDGAIIGQMGTADMHLPIQYALTYPNRLPIHSKKLDLTDISSLTFEKPDIEVFKSIPLAYMAIRKGGNMPTVYNAANERAVDLFLKKKISFLDITELIEKMLKCIEFIDNPSVDEILYTKDVVDRIIYEYI